MTSTSRRHLEGEEVPVDYAGTIKVAPGHAIRLWPHQEDAIKAITARISRRSKPSFAGLLVIPTGGGKTVVAIRWLLRNVVDEKKKVLWIAHRHELLEQAFTTMRSNAYSQVLPHTKQFCFRLISGVHGKPVHVQATDDIIIASKDSLTKGVTHLLQKWLKSNDDVFLVIDEAHHATAKTYRHLIAHLAADRPLDILGLTATPFRTLAKEKTQLINVFHSDIVYKIDLATLIWDGILAEPVFESLETNLDLACTLTAKELRTIEALDALPARIATQIAAGRKRNAAIVAHYVNNQAKYGQLLVFALNRAHAVALAKLFNAELNKHFKTNEKRYCDYVISGIFNKVTGVPIASEENISAIEQFRAGVTKVLVNVQILTEGIDLPKAKTVFLTRPTTSTILMTQMIGRVLRGEKVGGKRRAYIVSFIDNWENRIAWVSPESVCFATPEPIQPDEPTGKRKARPILPFVAIEKLEEFTMMMHGQLRELKALTFVERLPVGMYFVPVTAANRVSRCQILVYENLRQAFCKFTDELPILFRQCVPKRVRVDENEEEYVYEEEIEEMCSRAEECYFLGSEAAPGYNREDIKDLLRFYDEKRKVPSLYEFGDRVRFDLSIEAKKVCDEVSPNNKVKHAKVRTEHENVLWNDEEGVWRMLFQEKKELFVHQLGIEIERIVYPDRFRPRPNGNPVRWGTLSIDELSLGEIKKANPKHWRKLYDDAFAEQTDEAGVITCAECPRESRYRFHFQIDHIDPRSNGGKSIPGNLQVLCRKCNGKKSDNVGRSRERRIRSVFGLRDADPLPELNEETLRFFYKHITASLRAASRVRFNAHYFDETGLIVVSDVRLHPLKSHPDEGYGLQCTAVRSKQELDFDLADLEVDESDSALEAICDYLYWFRLNDA